MDVKCRIENSVEYLLDAWTTSDPDGTIPIKFSDQLAVILFAGAVCSVLNRYYVLGMKHERRRRKREMSRRFSVRGR